MKVPILFREEEYPQDLRSRCHLYIGIGHYLKSTDVETREARQNFAQSALHHLQIRYRIKYSEAEDRRQKTEDRRQKTEDRRQKQKTKTEDKTQKTKHKAKHKRQYNKDKT